MKITVTHDDGTEVDITEGVQIAYDCLTASMDWSSGMLDRDEEDAILKLSQACRFEDFQQIADQIRSRREFEERRQEAALVSHMRAQQQLAEQAQRQRIQDRGVWLP